MLVLKVIGTLIVIALVLISMYKLDDFFYKKFNKNINLQTTSVIISICYIIIFFSYQWYLKALEQNGDIYNGLILTTLCSIVILGIIIYNIKQSNFIYGLMLSTYQLIACIVGVGIIIFIIFAAMASNVRPVVNLN